MQTPQLKKSRARRRRADTMLVFDPAQKVPDSVLNAIIEEWLVPPLVKQFLREHGFGEIVSQIKHYSRATGSGLQTTLER